MPWNWDVRIRIVSGTVLLLVALVVFTLVAVVRAIFSRDAWDWVSPAVGLLFAGIVFVCG